MESSYRPLGHGSGHRQQPPATPSASTPPTTATSASAAESHMPAATQLGMLSPETAQRMRLLVGSRPRASKSSATSFFFPSKRRFDAAGDDDDVDEDPGAAAVADHSIHRAALLEYGSMFHSPGAAPPRGGGYPGSVLGGVSPVRSSRVSGRSAAGKRSRMSTASNASVTSTSSVSMSRDVAPLRAEIDLLREQLRKAESDRFLLQSKYDRDVLELEQRVSEKDGLVDGLQKKVEEYKLQRNAIYDQHKLSKAQVTELSDQLVKAKENGFILDTTMQTNTETSQTRIRHLETQLRNQISTASRTEKMIQHALAQSDAEVKKLQEANLALAKTNLDLTTQLTKTQTLLDTATANYVDERRKTLLAPRVDAQRKEARDHLAYAKDLEAETLRLKLALQRMAVDERRLASVEEERGSLAAKVQVLQRQVAQMAAAEAELKDKLEAGGTAAAEAATAAAEVADVRRQLERVQDTLRKRTESADALQAQVDALKAQLAESAAVARRADERRFDELRAKKVAEAQAASFRDEVEYFRGRVSELMAGIMANGSEGGGGNRATATAQVERWENVERELREEVAQAEDRAETLVHLLNEAFGWHVQRDGDKFRIRSHYVRDDDWWIELGLVPHPTVDGVHIWQIVGYGSPDYEQYVAVPKLEWEQAAQQAEPSAPFKMALAGFLADLATNHCRHPRT